MRLIILTFLISLSQLSQAQKNYSLEISGAGYEQFIKPKSTKLKDSLDALVFLKDMQQKAISKGYILASIDSLRFEPGKCKVHFFLGDRMDKVFIKLDQTDEQSKKRIDRFKEKSIANIAFTPKEVSKVIAQKLNEALNNGYPFASVQLDSVNYLNNHITAKLSVRRGKPYEWVGITIKGDSSISSQLISSLIGIKEGDKFNESLLRSISGNIKQINYLQEIKPFELLFTEKGVELFLYLRSVPVSSVNGIIGLQPNPVTERLTVTGEINLKLLNVLRKGENLQLNWRSIQAGTQSFNAGINYPFLFNSPFGIDGKFQLYKRDSTFLETRSAIGIQYLLGKGSYLKAFYQLHTSSLLSANQNIASLSTLNNSSYGFSIQRQQTDYLPNPSKGSIFQFETAIGSRKVNQGDTSEIVRSTTVRSSVQLQWFIPLTKRNVIKLGGNFESYYAPQIYTNELYRFGGLTTLRGFNEDEILASTKAVMTVEYRFLTDKNSHAFAFYDQAIYENTASTYLRDLPFGFGAGFAFGTSFGIFSITYAQGKQLDNPILLRNGKIHFGYVAFF